MKPAQSRLAALVKDVSRSFYLSIRFLPAATRWTVALAYGLARAADSVADTELVPRAARIDALAELIELLEGRSADPAAVVALCRGGDNPAEARLLEALPVLLDAYRELSPSHRELCAAVLRTLTLGMREDLATFPGASAGELVALDDPAQLDRYTYLVAGCVGEFWTRLHGQHLELGDAQALDALVEAGVRLGKGLQLVNVLRDCPRDLRSGRCYLPRQQLAEQGLHPEDLLQPACAPKAAPVLEHWLERACRHFEAGGRYLDGLPVGAWRLRLCSAWPLLLGLKTVRVLRRNLPAMLRPEKTLKVHRHEVYHMLVHSSLRVFAASGLRRLVRNELRRARFARAR